MPVTAAENCWLPPTTTCTETGDILTETGPAIVTIALPDLALSATDVAVIFTRFGAGTLAGAVYRPVVEIVPHDAPLHPLPLTLHCTAVFEAPVTVAANC
jgi:hypothetical protein